MPTALLGLATFGVLFEFLAFQLNNGNDPALGSSVLAAAKDVKTAKVDRPVINRKIIKTKVVAVPPRSTGSSAVPVSSSAPTSTVTSSALAPAPAPAPAPVTSSS
jgi:hypothetical protein